MILQQKPPEEWTAKDYEEVLCVRRGWLEGMVGRFNGFFGSETFVSLLGRSRLDAEGSNWRYVPRGICEFDPDWKQLIPYFTVFRPNISAAETLTYYRTKKAGEERLHGKRSIGFGGHIVRADGGQYARDAFLAGFQREVEEELDIPGEWRARPLGLINDDSTPVGSVHLGVVIAVELDDNRTPATARDEELADVEFCPTQELFGYYNPAVHDVFEDWSRIVLTCQAVVRDGEVAEGSVVCRSKCSVP
jgi:predicted NUDIX family phosphoesterase